MKKKYIITGSTSGVGLALINSFKDEDVSVIAIGRNEEKLADVVSILGPERTQTVCINLENVESIKPVLLPVIDNQDIDGFIHCAGFTSKTPLRKTTYKNFLTMMNVNFFSFVEILRLVNCIKEKDKKFRVVAISSCASVRASAYIAMYSATKAAIDGFIRSISLELIDNNIEINSIQPAIIDTPMATDYKNFWGDTFDDYIKEFQPLGLLSVEGVVEEIRHLINKKYKTMTGSSIYLNAGKS